MVVNMNMFGLPCPEKKTIVLLFGDFFLLWYKLLRNSKTTSWCLSLKCLGYVLFTILIAIWCIYDCVIQWNVRSCCTFYLLHASITTPVCKYGVCELDTVVSWWVFYHCVSCALSLRYNILQKLVWVFTRNFLLLWKVAMSFHTNMLQKRSVLLTRNTRSPIFRSNLPSSFSNKLCSFGCLGGLGGGGGYLLRWVDCLHTRQW